MRNARRGASRRNALPGAPDIRHTLGVSSDSATLTRAAEPPLTALLDGVVRGDRDALADLYRRTSAKLFGICVRMLDRAEAEEVLQEVYVTVWTKAGQFDAGKSSPITWLAALARNKAIDRLRTRRLPTGQLEEAYFVADADPSALDQAVARQEGDRLDGCIGELDPRHGDLIRAAFVDGLSYRQLADREQVPLGTMKSWIRRSLQRLKRCLEQ